MKNYGIVSEYNGYFGTIKGIDNIDYKFIKEDLLEDTEKNVVNKFVEFEPQIIKKTD